MIQSNYLPWRGYFDFIDDVDIFVIYDDVQYTRKDWRNRNRIKSRADIQWITVPVNFSQSEPTLIKDAEIDYLQPWQRKHIGRITQAYRETPFFGSYSEELFDLIMREFSTISELNIELIKWCMAKLEIVVPLKLSWNLGSNGGRNDRIINILQQLGCTEYLVGPAARAYIDESLYSKAGIRLAYKSYDYKPYPQLFGRFDGSLSIIDLLFNCGPQSRNYLKSLSPNTLANQCSTS